MLDWIERQGDPGSGKSVAKLDESELHLRPRLDWIDDQALLGSGLSRRLRAIHASRPADGRQFYLSLVPGIENPGFLHEPDYASLKPPDA